MSLTSRNERLLCDLLNFSPVRMTEEPLTAFPWPGSSHSGSPTSSSARSAISPSVRYCPRTTSAGSGKIPRSAVEACCRSPVGFAIWLNIPFPRYLPPLWPPNRDPSIRCCLENNVSAREYVIPNHPIKAKQSSPEAPSDCRPYERNEQRGPESHPNVSHLRT